MGYIFVDRELFEHPIWFMEPFSKGQAWVDLIGLASYEDGRVTYLGKVTECKRGNVYRSIRWLAKRWQWSPNKVSRFIDFLEGEKMVKRIPSQPTRHKTSNQQMALTICNYEYWQSKRVHNETESETESETPTRHRRDTIKKYKNFKNTKELSYPPKAADNEQDYEVWKWEMDRIKSGSPL